VCDPAEDLPAVAGQTLFEDLVSRREHDSDDAGPRVTRFHLTPREHQILALLSEGRSNRSIAEHLYLAEETVKGHVAAILRKLGVANRTQAAMMAVELGVERSPRAVTATDVPPNLG
jgi:DNA-binding NarL/FixJ family response regulator